MPQQILTQKLSFIRFEGSLRLVVQNAEYVPIRLALFKMQGLPILAFGCYKVERR
jgi:hypothetical protein